MGHQQLQASLLRSLGTVITRGDDPNDRGHAIGRNQARLAHRPLSQHSQGPLSLSELDRGGDGRAVGMQAQPSALLHFHLGEAKVAGQVIE